jgi:hypothetical protein
VTFLSSDLTIAITKNSELISSDWDPGRLSRDLVLKAAAIAGFRPITDLGQPMEPNFAIQPENFFLSMSRNSSELAFVKKASVYGQSAFCNLGDYLLFLDKRGRAYTNFSLGTTEVFDGALLALRMESADSLLWSWAWLNARTHCPWQEALETVSRSQISGNTSAIRLLIPEPPRLPGLLQEELRGLARLANSDIISEDRSGSAFRVIELKPGSDWYLREFSKPPGNGTSRLLGSMVSSVLLGKSSKSEAQVGIPLTSGKWLLSGTPSEFQDTVQTNQVLVNPGDVVTPSMGLNSQARVADQAMYLANGHYVLAPHSGVDPERISDFLNSRNAQHQRMQAVQSGIIPRLRKKDLLNFEFVESINVRSRLQILLSGMLSK